MIVGQEKPSLDQLEHFGVKGMKWGVRNAERTQAIKSARVKNQAASNNLALQNTKIYAAKAGAVRSGLDHRRVAGALLQAIMFHTFASTISGTSARADAKASAEELWELLVQGFGTS